MPAHPVAWAPAPFAGRTVMVTESVKRALGQKQTVWSLPPLSSKETSLRGRAGMISFKSLTSSPGGPGQTSSLSPTPSPAHTEDKLLTLIRRILKAWVAHVNRGGYSKVYSRYKAQGTIGAATWVPRPAREPARPTPQKHPSAAQATTHLKMPLWASLTLEASVLSSDPGPECIFVKDPAV